MAYKVLSFGLKVNSSLLMLLIILIRLLKRVLEITGDTDAEKCLEWISDANIIITTVSTRNTSNN
jgi:hypothetical protein